MIASGPSKPPAIRGKGARRIGRGEVQKSTSLHAARTRKEVALAELRELEVKRRREMSLDADAVARQWSDILRRVRAGVLAVVSRVRAQLPHLTAHDVEVLDRELRDALTALADGE
jgi:phage terminase Nu1 subunit (DNA packaging protein)